MTTIQDVAKQAGVGAATVSRVLSGKGYVKQETRERVTRAIKALNYTPNEMARNLFHSRILFSQSWSMHLRSLSAKSDIRRWYATRSMRRTMSCGIWKC